MKCRVCLTDTETTYCSRACKQKAYRRRRTNSAHFVKLSLYELIEATNWYLINEPDTITQKPNLGEILALLYGSEKKVKYEGVVFEIVE